MRKIFGLIGCGLLVFIFWATISASVENLKIDIMLASFAKMGVLDETLSTSQERIYWVDSEIDLDTPTYTTRNGRIYPGAPGDILCTKVTGTTIPVLQQGIEFYVGGHAALCAYDYNDAEYSIDSNQTLETTGFGNNKTAHVYSKNTWFNPAYNKIMAFRVKTSPENRFKAFNRALSFLGQPYNYSFIFNLQHSKYCSDLVSAAYEYVGIDLDYDGLATSVLDIMVSQKVFLTYYSTIDYDGVRHTYIMK